MWSSVQLTTLEWFLCREASVFEAEFSKPYYQHSGSYFPSNVNRNYIFTH